MSPEIARSVEIEVMVDILTQLGFEVEVVSGEGLTEKTIEGGELGCIDGRNANPITGVETGEEIARAKKGPKIPGALIGVVCLKYCDKDPKESLILAINDVQIQGFTPTLHGDDHHEAEGKIGCAAWSKLAACELENGSLNPIDKDTAREIVTDRGGKYRILTGAHEEERFDVNLRAGETPKQDGKNFALDLWFTKVLGIAEENALRFAGEVVRKAKPDVLTARILA